MAGSGGHIGELYCLNEIDAETTKCMTSDAQQLRGNYFSHQLCSYCGCIQIHYDPADALKVHYGQDYDLADVVQNNLVVQQGVAQTKKQQLNTRLFGAIDRLTEVPGRVLEIACGRGSLISAISAAFPNCECVGIDPSPDLPASTTYLTFIQDFFDAQALPSGKYDLVICHGFLNRSPTLVELKKIHSLMNSHGLLSVEIMVLEDSPHTPRVWDHSHMFTESVFCQWLAMTGFTVIDTNSNGTTVHLLAQLSEKSKQSFPITGELIDSTRKIFATQLKYWQEVFSSFEDIARHNDDYLIFGAGMFSGIILGSVGTEKFSAVVDEVCRGTEFFKLPVIDLQEAAERGGTVLVCSRSHYLPVILEKIETIGLKAIVLGR